MQIGRVQRNAAIFYSLRHCDPAAAGEAICCYYEIAAFRFHFQRDSISILKDGIPLYLLIRNPILLSPSESYS
jgi:hypothetical protein